MPATPRDQVIRQWQEQGYTHAIELARWPATLTTAQQHERLAQWRRRLANTPHTITLLPPSRPDAPMQLLLGPYRSASQAGQALLGLPGEVLLDEPKVVALATLR